jgi:hypothetical protein
MKGEFWGVLEAAASFIHLAPGRRIGDSVGMATLRIDLDDDSAREVEECARRERKSVSEWVKERIKQGSDRMLALADMEARAVANGYPPGWLALYGSLADDESFTVAERTPGRPLTALDGN